MKIFSLDPLPSPIRRVPLLFCLFKHFVCGAYMLFHIGVFGCSLFGFHLRPAEI